MTHLKVSVNLSEVVQCETDLKQVSLNSVLVAKQIFSGLKFSQEYFEDIVPTILNKKICTQTRIE